LGFAEVAFWDTLFVGVGMLPFVMLHACEHMQQPYDPAHKRRYFHDWLKFTARVICSMLDNVSDIQIAVVLLSLPAAESEAENYVLVAFLVLFGLSDAGLNLVRFLQPWRLSWRSWALNLLGEVCVLVATVLSLARFTRQADKDVAYLSIASTACTMATHIARIAHHHCCRV
jgi:hypothetical protein